ncbi:hypothetical protein BTM25_49450 [Actinomadura rubteroloni]|uniref:Carboxypeptidase regulatory-like domain-containing protein n=1 Tax=Actinomadura rubteroloni TaxID=1926885 RepID=A0A2P4UCG7_9ACTN|nr:carboxypeptidase regulatory-like domain-containing protein [Actinomadura rubteroloni]POM22741.1 hypothetical protein BTM25_49450 [Actinomadura rubteroloni]
MTDDELVAAVVRAFRATDPVPDGVLDASRAAFGRRTAGAVVAAEVPAAEPVGVRGDGVRRVAFAAADAAVEMEVAGREVTGRLRPAASVPVVVRRAGGETERTRTDAAGRFAFPDLARGPLSLTFELAAATVVTSWIRV